jgi:hypothetical protein
MSITDKILKISIKFLKITIVTVVSFTFFLTALVSWGNISNFTLSNDDL